MPVTLAVVVTCAVLFLVNFFLQDRLEQSPTFSLITPIVNPIQTFSTFAYPLLGNYGDHTSQGGVFISEAFACLWLCWIGASLERSWGSLKYAIFFLLVTMTSSLGLEIGSIVLKQPAALIGGLWIPVTALTVGWATINPLVSVMIYGLVPIQARWIAIFEVLVIYFVYYEGFPYIGLFVLFGCLVAYLVVKSGVMTGSNYRKRPGPDLRIVSGGSKRRPLDDAGTSLSLNPIDRYRAWQQRRKLAKLLQKSGFTDRDEDKRQR
jgi:hypothetical protein